MTICFSSEFALKNLKRIVIGISQKFNIFCCINRKPTQIETVEQISRYLIHYTDNRVCGLGLSIFK